jgi:hypothetical protein
MAITDDKGAYEGTRVTTNGKNTAPTSVISEPTAMPAPPVTRREDWLVKAGAGGAMAVGIAGLAAFVLAIIGLASYSLGMIRFTGSVAAIVIGATLLLQAAAIVTRFSHLLSRSSQLNLAELGGGIGIEFIGGVAGVVLGILALLNVAPAYLLPVAAIVLGATLILGSSTLAGLHNLSIDRTAEEDTAKQVARHAVAASGAVHVFLGLAGLILGIVAVAGFYPWTLSLTAMLCLGFALFVSGSSLGTRFLAVLRR